MGVDGTDSTDGTDGTDGDNLGGIDAPLPPLIQEGELSISRFHRTYVKIERLP